MTALALAVCLAAGAAFSAYGEDEEKISSVTLRVESEIEAGDSGSDVEVTTTSDKYEVDDVEVTRRTAIMWAATAPGSSNIIEIKLFVFCNK